MKKKVWSILFISIFLILTVALISAQTDNEQAIVDEAYQCLEDNVVGQCESLSLQEKIFSLLSIDQCQSELIEVSENEGEPWPAGDCNTKDTAQAILALDNTNTGTLEAQEWILSQNETTLEIEWYLEIETTQASSCQIRYSGSTYTVNVEEDKTLSNSAGSCLSLAQDDYWMRVSPSCFGTDIEISCDQDFLTTKLFKKTTSSTIHITEGTNSASSGGTTEEKVESYCFSSGESSSCNYESSLWSALVLYSLGEDVSNYLPYLMVGAEDNERLLPEAFLYILTGNEDYRSTLLSKQQSSQYWSESGNIYMDTALALYPLQNEDPQEKQNAKDWLFSVQDETGCWNNQNVRDTGFLLASIWPTSSGGGGGGNGGGQVECESAGYYCMSGASCGGEILDEYSCSSFNRCCSQPQEVETCSSLGGDICASNEICRGGNEVSTGDLSGGEVCCAGGGFCDLVEDEPDNACQSSGGTCRFSCEAGEVESNEDCGISGATCCMFDSGGIGGDDGDSGSHWWIWTLLVLIILTAIGIIFRDKLRELWLKLKSKFGKGRGSSSSPGGRPGGPRPRGPPTHGFPRFPSNRQGMRPPERRILLPKEQPQRPNKPSRSQKELDDVLKKLKEMSE